MIIEIQPPYGFEGDVYSTVKDLLGSFSPLVDQKDKTDYMKADVIEFDTKSSSSMALGLGDVITRAILVSFDDGESEIVWKTLYAPTSSLPTNSGLLDIFKSLGMYSIWKIASCKGVEWSFISDGSGTDHSQTFAQMPAPVISSTPSTRSETVICEVSTSSSSESGHHRISCHYSRGEQSWKESELKERIQEKRGKSKAILRDSSISSLLTTPGSHIPSVRDSFPSISHSPPPSAFYFAKTIGLPPYFASTFSISLISLSTFNPPPIRRPSAKILRRERERERVIEKVRRNMMGIGGNNDETVSDSPDLARSMGRVRGSEMKGKGIFIEVIMKDYPQEADRLGKSGTIEAGLKRKKEKLFALSLVSALKRYGWECEPVLDSLHTSRGRAWVDWLQLPIENVIITE
ncbi:hypothetical protein ADUPG1_011425 [Aduncisulcus paluster]|uniref:Uncharacterized protein n=1 Tax=Aduncisulcus paluster TaxID=2918883 RepID=A0ABQ5JZF8_9EUKA|nr:hypothetical protein ADUPG1_011425 [Aduncisulcus paluster]